MTSMATFAKAIVLGYFHLSRPVLGTNRFCHCHQPKMSVVPEKSVFRFSDFYDSHMVIPLSGTLISGIQDVIVLDSVLVIQGHTEDGASVSLFSRQGEYLCPLVRTGRGPGEMTDVLSIAYNPYTNTVDVLGNMGTVVNRYNIGSCELKDSFSIMETDIMAARDFCPVSEADYLFYKDYSLQEAQEYFVYLFDRGQGIVKDRFLPMDKELAEVLSFGQINNLFLYKGTAYYYAAFEKYVYRYRDGVFSPFIEFANNEYSFPLSLLEKKYKDTVDFVENTCKGSPYIWAHVNVFKYGSLIFSSYTYKVMSLTLIKRKVIRTAVLKMIWYGGFKQMMCEVHFRC